MTYLEALKEFTLNFKNLDDLEYSEPTLIIISASAIIGMLIVVVDRISILLFERNFLEIKGKKSFLVILVFWTIATVVVSYLGLLLNVINGTIQSCAIVGISWIYILSKIIREIDTPEATQN